MMIIYICSAKFLPQIRWKLIQQQVPFSCFRNVFLTTSVVKTSNPHLLIYGTVKWKTGIRVITWYNYNGLKLTHGLSCSEACNKQVYV